MIIPEGFVAVQDGRPTSPFLARWRAAGRALPSWRPLPENITVCGPSGRPTDAYDRLFRHVFGVGLNMNIAAFNGDGTLSNEHRAAWRNL